VSNQVEIIYLSGCNTKETGEIIRISARESARGIRPLEKTAWIYLGAGRKWYKNCLRPSEVQSYWTSMAAILASLFS
jgi:hypothetical protein